MALNIIKSTIKVGAKRPFTFLHMTDTHLTRTNSGDTSERAAFAKQRRDAYFKTADEELEFAQNYSEKTGYPIIHTGDLVDFITQENLIVAREFAQKTDMLFIAGNHEIHTCPNNVFCEEDFTKDLNNKQKNLDATNEFFQNDIDFFLKEINGVNLVGINNYDYQISAENLKKLKKIANSGAPIILFMHIPLYEEALYEKMGGALLSIPDSIMENQREFIKFEQQADEITKEAAEFIRNCPQIKCTVCGHLHFDFESPDNAPIKQYVTGLNCLREITVE